MQGVVSEYLPPIYPFTWKLINSRNDNKYILVYSCRGILYISEGRWISATRNSAHIIRM